MRKVIVNDCSLLKVIVNVDVYNGGNNYYRHNDDDDDDDDENDDNDDDTNANADADDDDVTVTRRVNMNMLMRMTTAVPNCVLHPCAKMRLVERNWEQQSSPSLSSWSSSCRH